MSSKQLITFAIISILLLVGIFLFWIIGDFVSLDHAAKQAGVVEPQEYGVNKFKRMQSDPLITSAAKVYKSFINDSDPIRGNPDAKLIILEFGDFECFYCGDLYVRLKKIIVEFDPQIQLVWKDFPNPSHLQARTAALAARCAQDQDKFWEYHDYLFENQDQLSREFYNQIALELNLDLPQFNKCLDSRGKMEIVGQGLVDGQKLGVDATPYLFIGNKRYDWALSTEELRKAIEGELGR